MHVNRFNENLTIPNFGTRGWFHGRKLFHHLGWGDGFRMIQEHCIYCGLYFYFYFYYLLHFYFIYCFFPTSDHQILEVRDPGMAHLYKSVISKCMYFDPLTDIKMIILFVTLQFNALFETRVVFDL